MAITIQEIQKQWGISRATVYKHIKAGKLSRLPNGQVDLAEVLRVYGEPSKNTGRDKQAIGVDNSDTQENRLLLEKIAFLESQLVKAEEREERLRKSEEWVKSQFEKAQETIQLLEHKKAATPQQTKKGLFGRLIGAINND
jgi:predicted transcriptional regulator